MSLFVLCMLYCFFIVAYFFGLVIFALFEFTTRFTWLKSHLLSIFRSILSTSSLQWLLLILFVILFLVNILGNIPLNTVPTLFYSETFTISLLFWVPLMICVSLTQFTNFIAHMLPYGAPVGLILVLPIIEIFSQLIRPMTLMIRLSTNLSAGHIIMYMFSYFSLLSEALTPSLSVVLFILTLLELAISALQAYIFVSLLSLYVAETV